MKLSTLAVGLVAAALVVFAVRSGNQESTEANRAPGAATAAVSPVKILTSDSCASDGCPVSCEDGDTLLSAFCISGSKARFADTLKLAKGTPTATCGTNAKNIMVYCGHP